MTTEEALALLKAVLNQKPLSKVEELVFRNVWEGLSYSEIATQVGYDPGYIKNVSYKLWQSLSKELGEKVTKNNLQTLPLLYLRHIQTSASKLTLATGAIAHPRQDWGEAIDVSVFYGRAEELATLEKWIVQDRCRLIGLLGIGGIGKTALSVRIAERVQGKFEYVIWRSLRNAPPVKDLLTELILFFSDQQEVILPETVNSQISRLMQYLRSSRCLLILDNSESILKIGERAGRYRSGYEGYGQLLRRVGDERHQSCLIFTSREKPIGLTTKEGKTLAVRSLQLTGLQQAQAQEIFKAKGLVASEDTFRKLSAHFAGNPLALKNVATTIQSLFDGDVSQFLSQGTLVFGDIWDLLDQQFDRLSALEKQVMYWLAINHKWVTLPELRECIVPTVSPRKMLEAMESLQARSLIEKQAGSFTQQPIVMEYMTERLRNTTCICLQITVLSEPKKMAKNAY